MCSSLVRQDSTCLLLCSPSRASQGFSFSPILAYLYFQASSMFSLYFFVSHHPRNDDKGFFYRKYDLGLLGVKQAKFIKILLLALQPQLPKAVTLSFYHLPPCCWHCNTVAPAYCPQFLASTENAPNYLIFAPMHFDRIPTKSISI